MARSRRQPKSGKSLKRRAAFRQERDRVLIVTEGSKTEPDYFRRLIRELGLTTAKVVIVSDGGSSPINVVEDTEKLLQKDEDFEHIYCVFDRDRHSTYDKALAAIHCLAGRRRFSSKTVLAITSVPCFEYWYLLHVCESRKPYQGLTAESSPGQALLADLCKYDVFRNYKKSDCDAFFESIRLQRETAIKRAEAFLEVAGAEGDPPFHENPSTRVHLVIKALQEISGQ